MTFSIIIVHCVLAILIFFIINWIGKHSYSLGYMELTLFVKNEDAPAFNFLIRVLTPIIFLIISSTIIYSIHKDVYVHNIYLVNVYYLVFRLFFSLITGRIILINWYRQTLYWLAIITISYFVYDKIIKIKTNILPDFSGIANELWIIVLVFVFHVFNNIRLSQNRTAKRKNEYLKHQFLRFKRLYGQTIHEITNNESLDAVVYAILIYESFNRPKIIRLIENLSFRITGKPHTLGIMQVFSEKMLTDKESVELGSKKIFTAYKKFLENYKSSADKYYGEWSVYGEIIADYNGGSSYRSEVETLVATIMDTFYKSVKELLIPSSKLPS